jgi:hypothetical protein
MTDSRVEAAHRAGSEMLFVFLLVEVPSRPHVWQEHQSQPVAVLWRLRARSP